MAQKQLLNSGILYTDRRDFYLSPKITSELWTDVTPFITVASSGGTTKVPDPDFKMFEHRAGWISQSFVITDALPAWSALTPGSTATVTPGTITGLPAIDSSWLGLLVEIWDTTNATKKGVGFITVIASSTTVTIKAIGLDTAAPSTLNVLALAQNDICYVIGTAFGEGTSAPDASSDELQVVYNSTGIFKTAVDISGTLYEAALRGYSSELARLREQKMFEHKIQKERAFLTSIRSGGTGGDATNDSFATHQTDADGKLVRTTMGIIPTINRYGKTSGDSQNIFTVSKATYKYNTFVADMEKVFQYVPEAGYKIAFCGPGAMTFWGQADASAGFIKNSGLVVNLDNLERDGLGFNFRRLLTPHGELRLVYSYGLRGPIYTNYMLIVDPSDLKHVSYRPMKYSTNVKTDNAYDGVKDQIMSDEGVGITMVEKHALMKITA